MAGVTRWSVRYLLAVIGESLDWAVLLRENAIQGVWEGGGGRWVLCLVTSTWLGTLRGMLLGLTRGNPLRGCYHGRMASVGDGTEASRPPAIARAPYRSSRPAPRL